MKPRAHSGDSNGDREFDSNVPYLLILIKTCSILVFTHFTWFFYPFYPGWWWVGSWVCSIRAKVFRNSSHWLTIFAIAYDGLWVHYDLPPIHKGPFRPLVGIMAHLLVSDLL